MYVILPRLEATQVAVASGGKEPCKMICSQGGGALCVMNEARQVPVVYLTSRRVYVSVYQYSRRYSDKLLLFLLLPVAAFLFLPWFCPVLSSHL